MAINCTGGQTASLQVQNLDCSCVSISSITWNQAGTQFTITLNNGQSITSPVLTGPAGTPIVPEFRASGTMLQYSVDGGTTWIDLYDLAALMDGILYNNYANASTSGTTWQTLDTYTLPAATLATDGDELLIEATFTTSSWTSSAQLARVQFGGNTLNTPLNAGFYASNVDKIVFSLRLSRISNTQVAYQLTISFVGATIGGGSVINEYKQAKQTISALNLTTTNYAINADGKSVVSGDVTSESLVVQLVNKK